MKRISHFLIVACICVRLVAFADEGMWLPMLLSKLNEKEMRSMGMKITAEDIYSINRSSLKDAIVSFGGFCTGEVISNQGLVLTNHHCGFGAIQSHSSFANNYIQDGFWAMSNKDELPNPSLFVTFIVRIEDVTTHVLEGVLPSMNEQQRQSQIDKNINTIRNAMKRETYQGVLIRPFFEGNQYYLFVTETFNDVRLVGAPPSSIGNFGKDTDNWMWPRHTGDFSLFRIYADKDNKPASYSPDNVPYKPKRSLTISLDGVANDDFTMVFGFPGRTNEYLPSVAVDQLMRINNPAKIRIRDQVLQVMDQHMRADEQIKIQYAAKWASVSNSWKKWQGELLGLTRVDALGKKRHYEAEFTKRVNGNPEWKKKYGTLLSDFDAAYKSIEPYTKARDYYSEIVSRMELFFVASQLNALADAFDKEGAQAFQSRAAQIRARLEGFYPDYSPKVDQKMVEALLMVYLDQEKEYVSPLVAEKLNEQGGSFQKVAEWLFRSTSLTDQKAVFNLLSTPAPQAVNIIRNEAAVLLFKDMQDTYQAKAGSVLAGIQDKINTLQRQYMAAQMEVFKERTFYPDANSTMRVTYGKVKGYEPRDGVKYDFYTYLDGVIEKYKPGDYEFDLPSKLIDLHRAKDYGPYAVNGKLPVCFIATNHTTGGNSGSPALDAYGNLVGLNFDRVWEGTMSDINYDASICRNIMVDVRYILFVIDKLAGATHLVNEMELVRPKVGAAIKK